MQKICKALGISAAAAALIASSTSALASETPRKTSDNTGAIIAGALVIGGLAAVAASARNDRRHWRGDRYRYDYGHRYGDYRRYGPQAAVQACVRAAERRANYSILS